MYHRVALLTYSSFWIIFVIVVCTYSYLFYTRNVIGQKFDELEYFNVQANRTTALRAEALQYILFPSSEKLEHLNQSFSIWASNNNALVQNTYPPVVLQALNQTAKPASGILMYMERIVEHPSIDLYTPFVTNIGSYNYAILSAENLLIENTRATREAAKLIDYIFLAISAVVFLVEYFYAIRPSLRDLKERIEKEGTH